MLVNGHFYIIHSHFRVVIAEFIGFFSLHRQTCGGRWCNLHRTVIETMLEPGIHNRIGHYTNGGAFGEG